MEKKTKRNVFKVKSRIARAKRSAINKATLELRQLRGIMTAKHCVVCALLCSLLNTKTSSNVWPCLSIYIKAFSIVRLMVLRGRINKRCHPTRVSSLMQMKTNNRIERNCITICSKSTSHPSSAMNNLFDNFSLLVFRRLRDTFACREHVDNWKSIYDGPTRQLPKLHSGERWWGARKIKRPLWHRFRRSIIEVEHGDAALKSES